MSLTRPSTITVDQLEEAARLGVDLAMDDRLSVTASDPMAAAIDPYGGTFDPPILTGYASA